MSTHAPRRKKEAASRVEHLMTKDVCVCRPSDSLNHAAQLLWENDIGTLPVVADDGSNCLVGILTDRDICMAAYTRGGSLSNLVVDQAMSRNVKACTPMTTLEEAAHEMAEAQVHRLPVVDGSRQLLGMLSLADLAREAARKPSAKGGTAGFALVGKTFAAIASPRST
ncbi:MAG TPA: CBS domain-containing protein [Myxococcota bacterium]|nr:CBS domain-containing protein [Myxococcota bacterium]